MFYSVEHVTKDDTYNCWNQYAVTDRKFLAYWLRFEAKMGVGRKSKTRVRELKEVSHG